MSEWISVKDRMPKLNDYYLCCNVNDKKIAWPVEVMMYTRFLDGSFGFMNYVAKKSTVTHWMPLPESPNN